MNTRTSIVSMVTISAFAMLLAACGGGGDGDNPPAPPPAPQPSAITSTLTVSPATALVADGNTSAQITVQLRDASGADIESTDADVVLQADFGNLDYTQSGGQVTGTLNSTQAGADTVSFSINGTASPNTGTAEFVAGPASATASSIVLGAPGSSAAPEGIADGVTPLVATVTLLDHYGNPLLHGGDEVAVFSDRGAVGRVADHGDGSYTADITSITAGAVTASFTLGNAAPERRRARSFAPAGASGAGGSFAPPPASTASAYLAPWTVQSCGIVSCVSSGIYVADTANPGAPATAVVSGPLMTAGITLRPFATNYRAYYDPTTDKVLQLGPATLVYAKDGRLHRLDLTRPGASPETLSTLSLTALCNLFMFGPYGINFGGSPAGAPAWVIVQGFATDGAAPEDCASGSPQAWLIPVDGNADTAPTPADYQQLGTARALVNPVTGRVEGLVVVSEAGDLLLYSPDLVSHTVLQAGFKPAGGDVETLNLAGLHDSLLMDVRTIGGGTRSDALYRVNASGASLVTTLSFSTANPYFDPDQCGGSYGDPAQYIITAQQDSTGTVYFDYPTAGGFAIEALGPSDTAPTIVYNESSAWCFRLGPPLAYSATEGRLIFSEDAAPRTAFPSNSRALSIAASGPAGQAPIVLAADASNVFFQLHYFSAVGDTAWIDDYFCTDPACSSGGTRIDVASPDGSFLHVFTNSVVGGDAQQGAIASTGDALRKYVAIAPTADSCTSTGWVLYDPATLDPVASPDFGSGNCSAGVVLYGPNDSFLLGSVANAAHTQVYAFALFGIGGMSAAFGPYAPLPGHSVQVVPMF